MFCALVDECCHGLVPLPGFSLLMATLSSAAVKSPERLPSTLAALEREDTSRDVMLAEILSASGKRPFFRSWEAMASVVTGHLGALYFCLLAG